MVIFDLPDLLVEVGQFAINLLPPVEVRLNFGVHVHFVLEVELGALGRDLDVVGRPRGSENGLRWVRPTVQLPVEGLPGIVSILSNGYQ